MRREAEDFPSRMERLVGRARDVGDGAVNLLAGAGVDPNNPRQIGMFLGLHCIAYGRDKLYGRFRVNVESDEHVLTATKGYILQ